MKVINRETESQQIVREEERNKREAYQGKADAAKENAIPTIKIVLDWRLHQEYQKYLDSKRIMEWQHGSVKLKKDYLKQAIDNRTKLNNIIVELYDEPAALIKNIVEIETDYATIDTLKQEANVLGLSFDVYIRGIFYTTAYEVNQQADREEAEWKAYVEESTPFRIGESFISQKLKRKLESSKYNHPDGSNGLYGIPESIYTDMLIELANEHFGLK